MQRASPTLAVLRRALAHQPNHVKDAERGKFEAEAATFKARTKACETKNVELMKVGNQILAGYRDLTLLPSGSR
jgi:hypothetical protein